MKNITLGLALLLACFVTLASAQRWTTYTTANGLASNDVTAIAIDKKGNKWFGTWGLGVSEYNGTVWKLYNTTNSTLGGNSIFCLAVDLGGNEWAGGGDYGDYGVSRFNGTAWTTYSSANGLASNNVNAIAIDIKGNRWFGTSGGGVSKFDGTNWTNYTTTDGLMSNWVWALAIDRQGNKWIGGRIYGLNGCVVGGGVSKFNDTNWVTYDTTSGLVGNSVSSIAIDSQGNRWFGTVIVFSQSGVQYGGGVSKFDGTTWTNYKVKDGLASNNVFSIAIDRKGNKWFGTDAGVSKFNDTTWTTYTTKSGSGGNSLAGNLVQAIAIDSQDNKWFGSSDGGVSMLNDTAQPVQPPLSAYAEGIDTTDLNGFALDSAFKVGNDGKVVIKSGSSVVVYSWGDGGGWFPYSFDEIKMAPSSGYSVPYPSFATIWCFVVKESNDTYSKIQILNKLPDGRYIFRYGANSTPNDHMLARQDYDRSVKYKPNNFLDRFTYAGAVNRFYWDPPLPNNNHLLGYLLYQSKLNVSQMDTSAPINLAQWDTVGTLIQADSLFTSGYWNVGLWLSIIDFRYLNLVAVYSEGNSDFLHGWYYFYSTADGVRRFSQEAGRSESKITIQRVPGGFFVLIQSSETNGKVPSASVYNMAGRLVARFSNFQNNRFFLSDSKWNLTQGLYIAKVELPNKAVLSKTFMFTR
jgi:Two component regulator propeller